MDNFNLKKYLTENKLIKEQADNEDVESGKAYVVIPFYSDGSTINENDVRVFTSYGKADNYFNTLQGSPIIVDTSID